jgi:hypothetical protein
MHMLSDTLYMQSSTYMYLGLFLLLQGTTGADLSLTLDANILLTKQMYYFGLWSEGGDDLVHPIM